MAIEAGCEYFSWSSLCHEGEAWLISVGLRAPNDFGFQSKVRARQRSKARGKFVS